MNLENRKRLRDLEKELLLGAGERILRTFGMDMYTLLYLKCITNKDLLYSTGNSAQCYVAAWLGDGFGGEWIDVFVWLRSFATCLKLSQYCC